MKEIKYEKLLDEGNIDSANDKIAELYLNIYFKQVNGDLTLNVPSGLVISMV